MNNARRKTAHPLALTLRAAAAIAALWGVLAPSAASAGPEPTNEKPAARPESERSSRAAAEFGRGSIAPPFIANLFLSEGPHALPGSTVFYGVEFSEGVTGFGIDDIQQFPSGLPNAGIVRVFTTGSPDSYTIEVQVGPLGGGVTSGTFGLAILDNDSIVGISSGEPLNGVGNGGALFSDSVFVSSDCNSNGLPDLLEINSGAPDCNKNGIPDTCDLAGFIPDGSYGPTVYFSRSNSPFPIFGPEANYYLEDCEDGSFNVPGVSTNGTVSGPGGLTDSVDGDDGSIDGSGTNGRSLFFGDGSSGMVFTFNNGAFGRLPQYAGVVWTDGGAGATVTFEAFDGSGAPIGNFPSHVADGSNSGTTAEDRFYGIVHASGIGSIRIRNGGGGIEVDHLQYGVFVGLPDTNNNSIPDECEILGLGANYHIDSTWRSNPFEPAFGWNTDLKFDDSDSAGWGTPFVIDTVGAPYFNSVWSSPGVSGGSDFVYLRKIVRLIAQPGSGQATISGIADDDLLGVFVNGLSVFNDADCVTGPEYSADISSLLHPGDNLVAVVARDCQCCGRGVQVSLRLDPGLSDCNGNNIPDDVDISNETSGDFNDNGVPDECEIGTGQALQPFPFDADLATDLPILNGAIFDGHLGAADLNSDGLTDFYITGANGPVLAIRNGPAASTYSLVQPVVTGTAFDTVAADFNLDGRVDLVSAQSQSPFGLIGHRNIPKGNPGLVSAPATGSTTGPVRRLAVIDANEDGRPDLIGLLQNGDIVRFINTSSVAGNLSFAAQTLFSNPFGNTSPSPAFDIAVADFDSDGHDDFAAVYAGYVVARGSGDGAFNTEFSDSTDRYSAVAAARLPASTSYKILFGLKTGGGEVFLPYAVASRSAPFFSSGTPRSIVVGDIDGDGRDDFAVLDIDGAVTWHKEDESGFFVSRSVLAGDEAVNSIALADSDHDGDLDLTTLRTEFFSPRDAADPDKAANEPSVVAEPARERARGDSDSFFRILPNRSLHRRPDFYSTNGIVTTGDAPVAAVVADINNDGKDDIVSATFFDDTIAWSTEENYDPAGWTKHVIINTVSPTRPDGPASVAAADFDNDGDIDVVAAGIINGVVMWFENQAGGTIWVPHMIDQAAPGASCVAVADFDNNGRMDIAAGLATAGQVRLYRNFAFSRTSVEFISETVSSTGLASVRALAAGDLNHDGHADIVACVYNANQLVTLAQDPFGGDAARPADGTAYERGISPLFFFASTPLSRSTPTSVALADLNNDGLLDIASTSFNEGSVRVHLAVEPLFYPSSTPVMNNVAGASSVIAVDIDRDGDTDLAAAGRTGYSFNRAVNLNRGTSWAEESFNSNTQTPSVCVAGDFDRDGLPDVAVGSFNNDRFTWSANYGAALYAYMYGTASAIFEGGSTSIADVYAENQAADGDPSVSYRRFVAYFYDRVFEHNGPQPRLLTVNEINALISKIEVFADSDGTGNFSVKDTRIGFRDAPFALDQFGTLSFALGTGNGNSIIPGENRRFFIVVTAATNASSANPNRFSALVGISDSTFKDTVFQEGVKPRFPGFYQTGTVTIAPDFRPRCPSDINANGITDTPDLVVLIGSFGKTVMPFTDGDLTGDGRVTTPDLVKLLSNFGHVCN